VAHAYDLVGEVVEGGFDEAVRGFEEGYLANRRS